MGSCPGTDIDPKLLSSTIITHLYLALYTLTSVYIFSLLISIYFLGC